MDQKLFGNIIKEKRNSLNLLQEELSEKSGVAIKTIHSIETGKGNPSFQSIQKLFEILELDLIIISSNPKK
ncbi:XRE family transcriptional regulator [Sandaracinomonas limnophila]|uniref:XRE family transcriptional regulator n=1 Tax=Sandaracinomonas limnophila TaxID=1862386 RepID=A0A437PMX2_9BACT|nr:XRE family transcriptional regulator [Sandaracinomonas limnophila]